MLLYPTMLAYLFLLQGTWFFGRTLCRVLPACQVETWTALYIPGGGLKEDNLGDYLSKFAWRLYYSKCCSGRWKKNLLFPSCGLLLYRWWVFNGCVCVCVCRHTVCLDQLCFYSLGGFQTKIKTQGGISIWETKWTNVMLKSTEWPKNTIVECPMHPFVIEKWNWGFQNSIFLV